MMENERMIRVYGTLRNWTVNTDIADFNPTRQGCLRVRTSEKDGSGHDDAIALAYQLYDNRFRECDRDLNPWERFLDIINKRVTNIRFISTVDCHEWADADAYTQIDGVVKVPGKLEVKELRAEKIYADQIFVKKNGEYVNILDI